jgi:L-seryl-tRNA(Ser) seleniumtransferase
MEARSPATKSRSELELLLSRLSGAQAGIVVHSYAGAIWLALAALASDREVLVARAEVGDVSGADSLPKLAAAANSVLREVGATNRSSVADYEAAASPRATAILKLSTDSYCVIGDTAAAELEALVALAREREMLVIDALGATPLVNPPAAINWPRRSAQASIAAGSDLVILRGDGLVGGPACGLLLGTEEIVRRIADHPLFHAWQIDALRATALIATLECYDSASRGADTLPVWQCLTTTAENLRNRAERMAAQLAHANGIASAVAVETRSPLTAALPGDGWPSFGVALSPAGGDVAALDGRLQNARFPIVGRVEGDRLLLDLRTVLPRQDKAIVDAILEGGPEPATQRPSASEF